MEEQTPVFLKTNHLSKEVQSGDSTITILNDVNLVINKGESVAILGASGSGKTTLLTLLAGLDVPTGGEIFFQGNALHQLDEEGRASLRANHVGFIFQSFQLLPTLTALENVMLPLEIQFVNYKTAKNKAIHWLEKVGLSNRFHHYPSQLSGGEQQRVAIARAFVTNPAVIFADEMTGNLDTHTGELISEILFSLNQEEETTLVIVTHDDSLSRRCHRRFLLRDGQLQVC